MERVKVHGPSFVLGTAAGVVLGGLAGWSLCSRYISVRFHKELDAELESIKSHYQRKAAASDLAMSGGDSGERSSSVGDGPDTIYVDSVQVTIDEHPGHEEERLGSDSPITPADISDAADPANQVDTVFPLDRDITKPYPISLLEFSNVEPGREQITLTYYAGDGILADDKDQPVRDVMKLVGKLGALGFGGVSGDPHIRLVRNEKMDVDFEITLNAGSYADAVLNYGKPK